MSELHSKSSSRAQALAAVALIGAALLSHCMANSHPRHPGRELRKLADCRVRVVWCQDIGDGSDTYAEGRQLRLMGFDSDDGLGERPILNRPWNYARPMITPRGDRVIFSSRADDTVYIVNWDGSGLKGLVEGFALDVWRDPADGREWLYYATDARPTRRQDERKYASVVRCPIDEPSRLELVWTLLPITQLSENNFQITGDGRRASQHGPDICVVNELPNIKWTPYGKGCWPSIAPDNSYRFWHFDGNHRTLSMYDPGPVNRRTIPLNVGPDLEPYEVFHPRWSNHPRYLTWTGPKRSPGGGAAMEVYVGRFNEDFTAIEQWIRLTYNPFADLCPDVWLESAAETKWPPHPTDRETATPVGLDWPVNRVGLLFIWRNRSMANEVLDATTSQPRICRVIPRGRTRFGRHFEMMTHGGWFEADGIPGDFASRIAATNSFALEIVCAHESGSSDRYVGVVTVLDASGETNLAIGVRNQRLIFTLRRGEEIQEFDLADALSRPTHLAVSFDEGSLVAFVAGHRVLAVPLTFANLSWNDVGRVLFGDPSGEWRGRLEHIAIYARRIFANEFAMNAEIIARRLAARQSVQRSVVKARLVQASSMPTPVSIAPYRSAMVAHAYDIMEVLEGELPHRSILAARWAILDQEIQPEAARHVGEIYRLELERFDDHPELEGERLVMDVEDVTRPLYYEVNL